MTLSEYSPEQRDLPVPTSSDVLKQKAPCSQVISKVSHFQSNACNRKELRLGIEAELMAVKVRVPGEDWTPLGWI